MLIPTLVPFINHCILLVVCFLWFAFPFLVVLLWWNFAGGLLLSFLATMSTILDHYLRRINQGFSIGFTSVLIIVSPILTLGLVNMSAFESVYWMIMKLKFCHWHVSEHLIFMLRDKAVFPHSYSILWSWS